MIGEFQRLNLGCGSDVRPGWVNHDVAALSGVDIVHDLNAFPWPFPTDRFVDIELINVLEHLRDTARVMEELHRISKHGARIVIRVPYWNSPDAISDPTHERFFNEQTFDFFDPATRHGRERPYYTTAKFSIRQKRIWVKILGRYVSFRRAVMQLPFVFLARFLGGVVWVLEVELAAIKETSHGGGPTGWEADG